MPPAFFVYSMIEYLPNDSAISESSPGGELPRGEWVKSDDSLSDPRSATLNDGDVRHRA